MPTLKTDIRNESASFLNLLLRWSQFASFFDRKQLMCVQILFPSLRKLCSFYTEKSKEISVEMAVDGYFYHQISDVFQPQQRKPRIRKGSKKISNMQIVPISRFEDTALIYPPRKNK